MAQIGRCVDIAADDTDRLVKLATDEAVALVIVGPEVPLVAGLVDRLTEAGIALLAHAQTQPNWKGPRLSRVTFATGITFRSRNGKIPECRAGPGLCG